MRIVPMLALIGAACCTARSWAEDAFGVWRMSGNRSTAPYDHNLIVRFERHPKGEVFTLNRASADGRTTTSSTLLYLDNKPREIQDMECSGSQSSRRVDSQTVEIERRCAIGERTRI